MFRWCVHLQYFGDWVERLRLEGAKEKAVALLAQRLGDPGGSQVVHWVYARTVTGSWEMGRAVFHHCMHGGFTWQ